MYVACGQACSVRVYYYFAAILFCAGIFKQSVGARNQVGIGLSYRPASLQKAGGIASLESSLGLLKCLKIRALDD
jgi:hypothetical protein